MSRIYRKLRDSGKTKDFLVFLVFVGIAAIFWFILTLNDDSQSAYDVRLEIENVPDSVTFITIPPATIHVVVRDRGINLMRNNVSGSLQLNLNFREFADNNRFRLSHSGLQAALRRTFGSSASISAVTPDSISLIYTTLPPQEIPVHLVYDATAAPGMVLGSPKLSSNSVKLYNVRRIDTLRVIYTDKIVLRDIDKNTTVEVPLQSIPGSRLIPPTLKVTFPVEQLVKKESDVLVEADNIPLGHDILFFPSRVRVSYYVPMSHYADTNIPVKVVASFNEAFNASTDQVGIHAVTDASYISNLELKQDSVEYSVVKSN